MPWQIFTLYSFLKKKKKISGNSNLKCYFCALLSFIIKKKKKKILLQWNLQLPFYEKNCNSNDLDLPFSLWWPRSLGREYFFPISASERISGRWCLPSSRCFLSCFSLRWRCRINRTSLIWSFIIFSSWLLATMASRVISEIFRIEIFLNHYHSVLTLAMLNKLRCHTNF